ncbi:hypothetical protein ACJMK2_020438 [Sinanodonta woodiana]|uniref:Tetraspanin n=1 Tax=Sinanodonta woodiana TaxID=1069815 RepID=A0ABD3TZF3_SINWO
MTSSTGVTLVIRVVFLFCNFLFVLMGVAMVAIGCYLKIGGSEYLDLLKADDYNTATALMIAAGIIVFIVAFIGCLGGWIENKCLLSTYFISVCVILALEIAAGVIGLTYKSQLDEKLQSKLKEGLRDPTKKVAWDNVQSKEMCCGVNNYTDWLGLADSANPNAIPNSCCSGPRCGDQGAEVAYKIGCYEKGKVLIRDNFYMLGAAGIVLGVLQVILLGTSLAYVICLRRDQKV